MVKIKNTSQLRNSTPFKSATFCSGIGSPEQSLKELNANHINVFACEKDKFARQTYLANFTPGIMLEDMTTERYDDPELYADLIIAGIPCQSFSLAGKRQGENDPRGLLIYDFIRYVRKQQPKVFIIENVKGLLSDAGGVTFSKWLDLLGCSKNGQSNMFTNPESLGYNLHYRVLNAKHYGLPQNRERVFIIGIRTDLSSEYKWPKRIVLKDRLIDLLETEVNEKYYLSDTMMSKLSECGTFINQDTQASKIHDIFGCVPAVSAGTHGYAMGYINELQKVGNVSSSFDSTGRIYSASGISPAIPSVSGGGYNSPLITVRHSNKKDGLIQSDLAPSIKSSSGGGIRKKGNVIQSVAFNGKHKKRIHNEDDILQCIDVGSNDSGAHNALVLQKGRGFNKGALHELSPPISSHSFENNNHIVDNYRIRRYTPLECMRLMGYPDTFIKPCSETQTYKQAGNSICVHVMKAVLKPLLALLENSHPQIIPRP